MPTLTVLNSCYIDILFIWGVAILHLAYIIDLANNINNSIFNINIQLCHIHNNIY